MKTGNSVVAASAAVVLGMALLMGCAPRAAAADECDRACLQGVAEKYLAAMLTHDPANAPLARDARLRLENGSQTSGRQPAPGAERNSADFGCKEAFALGYYHEDTRLRNRRVLAVDVERGLVYTGVYLDHDATIRSYQLKDGRTNTVRNTGPWTWEAHEIFQVNGEGKISQIEAVLQSVPYGMRPGWTTGVHLPSEAVRRDGFREY